jgi:DNA invertase Pin-like site-specific DNA recombinase
MARYGYARISTRSQRDDSQLDALRAAGCERNWTDTASGKLARRPEWDNCLDHLRRGDELVVTRLSRMARSVRHLTEVAALLEERGIDLVVLKQGIDTTTPAGRFTFHVLAAMDEMLADLISEGTREGLESARARGRVGGRKPKLTARQAEVARGMYDETGADGRRKYTVAEIAGAFAVSRKTIYRHLDNNGAQRQPDKSTRPRPVTRPGDTGATRPAITPAASPAVAQARPQRQRSGRTPAALACPACGHQPASRPEALRQREDLAIVWLHQDSPAGPISQHRHCASCQPHIECGTVECAHCGDGPILTGALVDQLRKHDPDQPTALRAWLTSHGWQLEPEPLCSAHSNSIKD